MSLWGKFEWEKVRGWGDLISWICKYETFCEFNGLLRVFKGFYEHEFGKDKLEIGLL